MILAVNVPLERKIAPKFRLYMYMWLKMSASACTPEMLCCPAKYFLNFQYENQCCGSGMFIPDPGSDLSCHPGSYIKK
jgi:hypothetical protein